MGGLLHFEFWMFLCNLNVINIIKYPGSRGDRMYDPKPINRGLMGWERGFFCFFFLERENLGLSILERESADIWKNSCIFAICTEETQLAQSIWSWVQIYNHNSKWIRLLPTDRGWTTIKILCVIYFFFIKPSVSFKFSWRFVVLDVLTSLAKNTVNNSVV